MDNQLVAGIAETKIPVAQPVDESITVFKRYPNRKLYNPSVSSYVTLKDIFKLVVDGKKVQVINTKTQEDVTTTVLLSALVENSKGQDNNQVATA